MEHIKKVKFEFVALMASLMSLVALTIDALLPALPEIGASIGTTTLSENQLLITMIFLGIGCGQLVFGPLSDSFGRKPIVYVGFVVFIIASIICVTTQDYEMMLFGRILQGIGLSSPRSLTASMIRDEFSGDYMAKILSFVVMFFILVPVIAPLLGQFLMHLFNWKAIFYFNLIFGLLIMIWFLFRQRETLPKHKRIKFTSFLFISGAKEFFKQKEAVAFTLVSGFITGSFMVYLSTAQQIFQEQYHLGEWFPYIFASLAISIGFATFLNSQLVEKFGMMNMAFYSTMAYAVVSVMYVILFHNGENPSIYALVSFLALQFFAVGFLFGNLRALAMQPLGHIAGIGAAINGFLSTVLAVPIAHFIGGFVKTSVLPLFMGFSFFGILSLSVFLLVKRRGKLLTA
ncbi:multidrug effflux MFS transporter [Algibacter pacificus]|uniref:multidrug effflux MFS transporter n=1 Tax=Algibacter pacificus TaxID=2599389 RepID=UPI0011C6FAC3|nr:multidrug effflux MFS transporter [Algibacter pacificus]